MWSRGYVYAPFLLVLVLVISCVTEYQPDSISIPPALVVEGLITDQPGPYFVKLTRTADYSYKSLNLLETGATVIISDDLGNKETLIEQSPGGNYRTSSIQGVAGRTYKLTIKTQNGEQYESETEQIKASPPIGRLYYEYRYQSGASDNGQANGWDVYVDSKDPETPGDFYRWEWAHYEFTNVCKLVYVTNHYEGIPCCSDCWDITRCYINCINIMSDVNINGNSISRQFITRVPYTSGEKYYLEVTQQRLSKGIYEFFKAARQQVTNTGGLFDAAPGSIVGNIHSVSGSGAAAYGYFGAVGESVSHVLVDRSNAIGRPVYTNPVYTIASLSACIVCENSQYRTPVKPRWW
ncbi:DUF4249 domain-containing protein [Spirosoma foliorum]|uniref:DUF4249 domain-containing protein n=1 Tax=Spirosoma foliorum TaxID=2710596 RepID=A0A7G5H4V6_9BACT|nr:DUF4249 domain-containing protein [Spirosoma foliorum]QMW06148.1 DUF4249 domain-containing protein [Spirosoma foliorum]